MDKGAGYSQKSTVTLTATLVHHRGHRGSTDTVSSAVPTRPTEVTQEQCPAIVETKARLWKARGTQITSVSRTTPGSGSP